MRDVALAVARIALAAAAVAVAAQLLIAAAPGSPGERAARAAGILPPDDSAIPGALRADLVSRIEARFELDRPLAIRVAASIADLAGGDFGRSWASGRPVRGELARGARLTLPLIAAALVLAGLLGVAAAAARGRARFAAAAAVSAALVAPPVWIGLLLLDAGAGGAPALAAVATLALLPAAVVAHHAAASLAALEASPWALAARARGVSERRLLWRYGSRELGAELAPLVPVLCGYLLGASMIVERVFGLRGLGALLADASGRGDAPVVVGVAVLAAVVVAVAGAAARALRRRCDPRPERHAS